MEKIENGENPCEISKKNQNESFRYAIKPGWTKTLFEFHEFFFGFVVNKILNKFHFCSSDLCREDFWHVSISNPRFAKSFWDEN